MKNSKEINEKLKEMKKEYMDAAQSEFKEGANELFDKHPRLKSFAWTQYTPYFNDGDTCYFGVNDLEFNGYDYDGEGGEGENLEELSKTKIWDHNSSAQIKNPNYDKTASDIIKEVNEFFKSFDDDVYEEMFGDHMKVTVSKNKIETDEYEHD